MKGEYEMERGHSFAGVSVFIGRDSCAGVSVFIGRAGHVVDLSTYAWATTILDTTGS